MGEPENINRAKSLDVSGIGCMFIGVLLGTSFIILIYQGGIWLYSGNWKPMPLSKFIFPVLPDPALAWLLTPKTWIGLAKLISYIVNFHVSLILVLSFVIVSFLIEILE